MSKKITKISSSPSMTDRLKSVGGGLLGAGLIGGSCLLQIMMLVGSAFIVVFISLTGYDFFQEGRVFMAVLTVFLGIPLALWFVSILWPIVLLLAIISGAIWLVSLIFGADFVYLDILASSWDIFLLVALILFAVFLVASAFQEVKQVGWKSYFKQAWFNILILVGLSWYAYAKILQRIM